MVSLEQWLLWLSEPSGIGAAAGVVLSWVAEYFPWWYPHLAPRWKRLVFLAVCLALPLAAAWTRTQLGYVEGSLELYWQAIAAGALAFSSGQGFHGLKYMGRKR